MLYFIVAVVLCCVVIAKRDLRQGSSQHLLCCCCCYFLVVEPLMLATRHSGFKSPLPLRAHQAIEANTLIDMQVDASAVCKGNPSKL